MDKLNNIHPGEILLEEFLIPINLSQNRLANAMGMLPAASTKSCWAITADTALRLAKVFGNSVHFWMGLQDEYEVREAGAMIQEQLEKVVPIGI